MADETNETTDAVTVNEDTDRTAVATSNVGYAEVPEGWVFIPTTTGDTEVLKKLFDAVENPEDVITRAGYGYVVPEAAAKKAGLETEEPVAVIDLSTPDTTPAESATDTQPSPMTTDDITTETAEQPLLEKLAPSDPARHPDDEGTEPPAADPEPAEPNVEPVDDTAATDPAAEGEVPADTTTASSGSSKKGSAASAAS